MALFKISKGQSPNLPDAKNEGWCYFTTDENQFYVDVDNNTRVPLNSEKTRKDWSGNIITDTYSPKRILANYYLPAGSSGWTQNGEVWTYTQPITDTGNSTYFLNQLTSEDLPLSIFSGGKIDIIQPLINNSIYVTDATLNAYNIESIQIIIDSNNIITAVKTPGCLWGGQDIILPVEISFGFQNGVTFTNPFAGSDGSVSGDASTYVTKTELAAYPKRNSPVFSGTPTAPTAAPGTNTTQLATTAFVQEAIQAAFENIATAEGGSF